MIQGKWRNFEFKPVGEEDYENVLKHLRQSFYKDEPIQKVVGMTEDRANDLDRRIGHFLKDKMSFMAIDEITMKIAGVMILLHCTRDKKIPKFQPTSPLSPIVRSFIQRLEGEVDVFSKYGVNHYGEIFIVSVSQEYRSVGLATEMFRRSVDILREMDYSVIKCTFSNPISRKLGEKFGFQEVHRLYFREAKDEHGNLTMASATPEQFACVTVLELK